MNLRVCLRCICIVLAIQLTGAPSLLAHELTEHNLDLTSTERSIPAEHHEGMCPVIQTGDASRAICAGDLLTPAEHVAVHQILSSGQQSVVLSELGNAIGGTIALTEQISQTIHSLLVPPGVTVFHNFGVSELLNISGPLTNLGSILAVSSNPDVVTATINASDVVNGPGALISSVLSAGGLPGIVAAVEHLNLAINAVHDVVNQGAITSAGSLTITAGGSIINTAAPGGPAPLMQAVQDLNLTSGVGSIVNSGILASLAGNVNISAITAQQGIAVSNVGGRLEALAGAIHIRDALFQDKADTALVGGDVLSRELNLYSGAGKVNVDVEKLLSTVNIFAHDAHVSSATDTLSLGTMQLGGDPTFYNSGDIIINQPLVFHGASNTDHDLALVAGGNITTGDSAGAIDTSSTSFNGGQILLVAGANFSKSPSTAPGSVLPDSGNPGDTSTTINITGASSTGGKIDLTTGAGGGITSLTSRSANGKGGNITMVAYSGTAADSGTITLPANVTVTTGGSGNNANGDVNFLAAATSGTPIQVGPVDTTGGNGGAGSVYAGYANIAISGGGTCAPCVSLRNGTVTAGAFVISKLPDFDIDITKDPNRRVATGQWSVRSPTGLTMVTYGELLLG